MDQYHLCMTPGEPAVPCACIRGRSHTIEFQDIPFGNEGAMRDDGLNEEVIDD